MAAISIQNMGENKFGMAELQAMEIDAVSGADIAFSAFGYNCTYGNGGNWANTGYQTVVWAGAGAIGGAMTGPGAALGAAGGAFGGFFGSMTLNCS